MKREATSFFLYHLNIHTPIKANISDVPSPTVYRDQDAGAGLLYNLCILLLSLVSPETFYL